MTWACSLLILIVSLVCGGHEPSAVGVVFGTELARLGAPLARSEDPDEIARVGLATKRLFGLDGLAACAADRNEVLPAWNDRSVDGAGSAILTQCVDPVHDGVDLRFRMSVTAPLGVRRSMLQLYRI